ncbi:MAG: adenosylmethionine decarboxylase [Herpetosiphon sp.]
MSLHAPTGRHLLLTLHSCHPNVLDDPSRLADLVRAAVSATGAQVLNLTVHHFIPHGVTALALLSESHASLHTYPEQGLVYWDCFTCGADCDPLRSVSILVRALCPASIDQQLIVRASAPSCTTAT